LSKLAVGVGCNLRAHYWQQIGQSSRLRALVEAQVVEQRQCTDVDPLADGWAKRETADLVRGVLAELSVEYSSLLTGKYLDELSLEDLARCCGSSTEATKSKLARARREFRAKFEALTRVSSSVARGC